MMDFGIFLLLQSPSTRPPQEVYARAIEQAQAAESLGFRNAWLAEHHFSTYGYLSRPLQFATHIAARTTRLRVGTAVVVVPLHHPLIIAEEIATLDLLSGGRIDIGLGRGYQRYEFERLGLQLDSGGQRWDESLDILVKAFEGKPFTYEGKIFKIAETSIFPQPVQKPHPPIWVVAQSPYSLEAAGRRGFNVLTGGFGVSFDRLAEFGQVLKKTFAEMKYARLPTVGVQKAVYVTTDKADARDAAQHALWNMRVTLSLRNNYEKVENGSAVPVPGPSEPGVDELLENYFVIGAPDFCARQIKRIRDCTGMSYFNCNFCFGDLDQKRVLRSMELFASEVAPALN